MCLVIVTALDGPDCWPPDCWPRWPRLLAPFFAAFLLPLWAVFYGRKGGMRFVVSVMGVTAVLISCLLLTSGDANSFVTKLVTTANWTVFRLLDDTGAGADASLSQLFVRIPMAAVFFVMLTAMTVLPRPRNLENLLANSTSLIVAAQMWYPDDIGTYVLWYLPLFLLERAQKVSGTVYSLLWTSSRPVGDLKAQRCRGRRGPEFFAER